MLSLPRGLCNTGQARYCEQGVKNGGRGGRRSALAERKQAADERQPARYRLISEVEYEPGDPGNVAERDLAAAVEIGRDTVVGYMKNLGDANLLNLLYSEKKSVGKLTKPDKVYLENTNLAYALSPSKVEIGTMRETFAITHLSENHLVEYGKDMGDFMVDSKYRFEIGGKDKTFKQIANLPHSYIFADDIDAPSSTKLPLWMLGFLY